MGVQIHQKILFLIIFGRVNAEIVFFCISLRPEIPHSGSPLPGDDIMNHRKHCRYLLH